jgi:hypothetical protein
VPDLRADAARKPDKVPPKWYTVRDHAAAHDLSIPQTSQLLRDCVRAGLYEVKKFRIHTGSKLYPVPHYRKK